MVTKKVKGMSTGPGNQAQLRFNEDACSDKVSEVGLNYFWGGGLLGALGAAVQCGAWKPVMVFNTDVVPHFVAFGDSAVAAPAGAATGVPVLAGQALVLSSGSNTHVISDSALVFGYVASENVSE